MLLKTNNDGANVKDGPAVGEGTSRDRQDIDRTEAGASTYLIETRGLNFGYGAGPVFRDFAFRSEARISVFRGPSGCGKTTLLKLLYGLMAPNHADVWNVPAPAFLVLQSDTLVPWFTGTENIRKFSEPVWERIRNGPFYDLVRPFIEKRACEMSYGQRRTIELARAFSTEPPLLLLDEPFNFLDPEKRRFFLQYLNNNCGQVSSRIVLTSHYVEDVPIGDADSFDFSGEMPYAALAECRSDA